VLVVFLGYSMIAGALVCHPPKEGEHASVLLSRRYARYCIAAGGLLLMSYVSAWVARGYFEQGLADKVAIEYMRGRSFKVPFDSRRNGAAIFAAGGYPATQATKDNPFPWADVGATHIEGPFEVSVEWDWCLEPTYGGGGRQHFFCF